MERFSGFARGEGVDHFAELVEGAGPAVDH